MCFQDHQLKIPGSQRADESWRSWAPTTAFKASDRPTREPANNQAVGTVLAQLTLAWRHQIFGHEQSPTQAELRTRDTHHVG